MKVSRKFSVWCQKPKESDVVKKLKQLQSELSSLCGRLKYWTEKNVCLWETRMKQYSLLYGHKSALISNKLVLKIVAVRGNVFPRQKCAINSAENVPRRNYRRN